MTAPDQTPAPDLVSRITRFVVRILSFPVRVLAYPFRVLHHELGQLRAEVAVLGSSSVESASYVGLELRRIAAIVEEDLPRLERELKELRALVDAGRASLASAELPFAFRSLAGIEPPARILQVGVSASTSLALAALGYQVTVLDPDGGAVAHPLIDVVPETLESWDTERQSFGAALLISGLDQPTNGVPRPDRERALSRLAEALTPGGLLILTLPLEGDRDGMAGSLAEMLEGWDVSEQRVVARRDQSSWAPLREGEAADQAIALIAARRSPGS